MNAHLNRSKNIAVIPYGLPGAGKDQLQGRLRNMGFTPIGTGEIIRTKMDEDPAFKSEWLPKIKKGHLVDRETVYGLVSKRLETVRNNPLVLNGAPRTLAQAEDFIPLLKSNGWEVCTIYLNHISEEECKRRILSATDRGGRHDDTEDAVAERFSVYNGEDVTLRPYLEGQTTFYMLDAKAEPDAIFAEAKRAIGI